MSKQLKNVSHDYIRYANCWEDADVLIKGLQIKPADRVLSIGSAGDNSFSLLAAEPQLVVAVDINPVQINLIELKKAAIRSLEHHEYLKFIGFEKSDARIELFDKVKTNLTSDLRNYWSSNVESIKKGIIHQGKFERYFQLFHNRILPLIHTQNRINQLFENKNEQEQREFHNEKWNNWRWRTLFKVFFSNYIMGKFGRDPAFLNEVSIPVSSFILNQAEKHLCTVSCQENYFLHYILKGDFGITMPHYVRQENYDRIKENIDRLEVFNGWAEDAFKKYDEFDKFNLSNIYEYMNPKIFKEVSSNINDHAAQNARFVYWNLMVPRNMSTIISEIKRDESLSSQLSSEDKGFFYANVNVDIKK